MLQQEGLKAKVLLRALKRPCESSVAPPAVHSLQAAFTISESSSLDLSTNSYHESMKEVQETEDSEDEGLNRTPTDE